jgi:hypothetical protein
VQVWTALWLHCLILVLRLANFLSFCIHVCVRHQDGT